MKRRDFALAGVAASDEVAFTALMGRPGVDTGRFKAASAAVGVQAGEPAFAGRAEPSTASRRLPSRIC